MRTNTEGSAQGANKARPFLENNYLGCLDQPVPEWHEEKSMENVWNSSWSEAYSIICETWWSSDGMSTHGFQWHWIIAV